MKQTLKQEIERVIKNAQREALEEVFEIYMEKRSRIEKLLNSEEYNSIAKMANGERFTRLQKAWFDAFDKSNTYLDVAIEISKIIRKYY